MKTWVIVLIQTICLSTAFAGGVGLSLSKKLVPRLLKEAIRVSPSLKHDLNPSRPSSIKIELNDIVLQKKLILSELDSSQSVDLIKEISNFYLFDELNTQIKIHHSKLTIDIGEDIKIDLIDLGNQSLKAKILVRPKSLYFKTPLIEACDGDINQCHDQEKVQAKGVELFVPQGQLQASFDFVFNYHDGSYSLKLEHFKSNLDELDPNIAKLKIAQAFAPMSIRVDGVERNINTSGLRKALLSQKRWILGKVLDAVAVYLFKDFSKQMTMLLAQEVGSLPTHFAFKKKEKISDTEFKLKREKDHFKKDQTQIRKVKLKERKKSFIDFLKLVIKTASFSYQIKEAMSSKEELKLLLNPELELNGHSFLVNLEDIETDMLNNKGDVKILLSENYLNEFLSLVKKTGLLTQFYHFLGKEQGVRLQDIHLKFVDQKIILIPEIEIDLSDTAHRSFWDNLSSLDFKGVGDNFMSFFSSFLERTNSKNGTSVLLFPLEIALRPYLDGNALRFEIEGPALDEKTLKRKHSQEFRSNFHQARSLIRKGIIKKLGGLTEQFTDTKVSSALSWYRGKIDSKIVLIKAQKGVLELDLKITDLDLLRPDPQVLTDQDLKEIWEGN